MTLYDRLRLVALSRKRIERTCLGYSGKGHWNFFRNLFSEHPGISRICILGVYYGRDIAFMSYHLGKLGREFHITGVDKFEDQAGEDWPDELKGKTWQEAGFGPAPKKEFAQANLEKLGFAKNVTLVQDTGENFLRTNSRLFDFVYIDVSHDYETTKESISLARRNVREGGWIGGDDFSNEGTWGVKKAVQEAFSEFDLVNDWIWLAQTGSYQPAARAGP